MHLPWALCTAPSRHELFSWLWQYCKVTSIKTSCLVTCLVYKNTQIQSKLAIRNFLVALILFLNAKSSLSLWSKWQIGHRKWFLLIPICSLSNRSLLLSLTVLDFLIRNTFPWAILTAPSRHEIFSRLWQYCKVASIKTSCLVTCLVYKHTQKIWFPN